jgi:uncharacterized protein (DUF305 family)
MIGMTPSHAYRFALSMAAALALAAGSGATRGAAQTAAQPASTSQDEAAAIAAARADSARYPYTAADIHFMTGMIPHHAQAIVMAGWALSHGASASVQTLASRIINAQQDEIRTMRNWLRDRRQPVPDSTSTMMSMPMNGADHEMLMPGMLTEAQMKQLDAARGEQFDQLFLRFMIQHHRGAISMVQDLFNSYGAAQNPTVFKIASDINVDQTTEVARMQKMLASLLFGTPTQ